MKLYFLRHAEAHPGANDFARELTDRGRADARQMARFLSAAGVRFDAAFSSPLVRAVQTANEVLPIANPDGGLKLETVEALTNESPSRDFQRWLMSLRGVREVLLVGHNPSLTLHVARMLGCARDAPLSMSKGAVFCLKTEDRVTAELKLYLSPKVLPAEG